jgi:hypothetical protein
MSALGQKQTSQHVGQMSTLPPESGHAGSFYECPLRVNSGHSHLRLKSGLLAAASVSLSHSCAQSVEFFAASLAKLAEKIERISVGSDKIAELWKTLVGLNISIENFSSYFFSACYDSRRRKNAHSTDRCMECNQGWDIASVMLKCVDIALGCILDEFFIQLPPTVYFLRHPLDPNLPLVQQP